MKTKKENAQRFEDALSSAKTRLMGVLEDAESVDIKLFSKLSTIIGKIESLEHNLVTKNLN